MGAMLALGIIIGTILAGIIYWWNLQAAPIILKVLPALSTLSWWDAIVGGFWQWYTVYYPWVSPILVWLYVVAKFAVDDN